ncbi:ClpX C4-type zinc finger protein [Tolypothrix sp. NIES-4075]|uniref:ClpX C4-type zinc finger protein n=1 Tax=Tolypothrix sp. NIES-4075 TaxID=2005459 RepID=UPI000B5C6002
MACSFCGRNHKQVDALISGPMIHIRNDYLRLFICNDCVRLCNEIIEEMPEKAKS